jgi:hypothetical protein
MCGSLVDVRTTWVKDCGAITNKVSGIVGPFQHQNNDPSGSIFIKATTGNIPVLQSRLAKYAVPRADHGEHTFASKSSSQIRGPNGWSLTTCKGLCCALLHHEGLTMSPTSQPPSEVVLLDC